MRKQLCLAILGGALLTGCQRSSVAPRAVELSARDLQTTTQLKPDAAPRAKVNAALIEQTTYTKSYDPAYTKLDYPNGDVPLETGVCADVIVRALRQGGVDLQKEIHEDMTRSFAKYPQKWGARRADKNIDHRRVPNLMTWFARQGKSLPLSDDEKNYQPGDIVAWELGNGLLHIGMVGPVKVAGAERYAIVHNIGQGARLEDVLFAWKVIGHYRYFVEEKNEGNATRPRP